MELYRTTSVKITMLDSEVYVFRSFNDRVQVLHVLKGLKILADRNKRNRRGRLGAGFSLRAGTNRTRSSYQQGTSAHSTAVLAAASISNGGVAAGGSADAPPVMPARAPSKTIRSSLSSSFLSPVGSFAGGAVGATPANGDPNGSIGLLRPPPLNRLRSASDSMLQPPPGSEEDLGGDGSSSRYMSAESEHYEDDMLVGGGDLYDGHGLGEDDEELSVRGGDAAQFANDSYEDDYGLGGGESVESLWAKAKEWNVPNTENVGMEVS